MHPSLNVIAHISFRIHRGHVFESICKIHSMASPVHTFHKVNAHSLGYELNWTFKGLVMPCHSRTIIDHNFFWFCCFSCFVPKPMQQQNQWNMHVLHIKCIIHLYLFCSDAGKNDTTRYKTNEQNKNGRKQLNWKIKADNRN